MIKQGFKKKLSDYLLTYKMYLIGVFLALLVTSSCVLLLSHSFGYIIDKTIIANDPKVLTLALVFFMAVALVLAVATSLRYGLITLTGEYITRDIRRDIYNKILALSPFFYEKNQSGAILSHLTADVTLLQSILSSTISVVMRNVLMLVGSLVMLTLSSVKLTIMIIMLVPIIVVPIIYFNRKLKSSAKFYQNNVGQLSAISEETISFIKTIQAYAQELWQRKFFEKLLEETLESGRARIKTRAILVLIIISLIFCGIGCILWVGGQDVLSGALTLGQLTTFIFLAIISATTAMSIIEASGEIQRALAAAERIFAFLSEESTIQEALELKKITNCDFLEFSNVEFAYPSDTSKVVLRDISFSVKKGKMLAIVGESGAGKSTIMQLVLRFYDVQSGSIMIDGTDIRSFAVHDLRKSFGYVGQDSVIFSTSAYNNILYGRPDATREEVIEAAKAASAYKFIEKLSDGLDTHLGEKGVKLSGGQKQRIAIARAILKDPQILLLDEATSALDTRNEIIIQHALEKLMYKRTTIVIAHRLSTIVNADQVILIKDAVIAARGQHRELIEHNADYQRHFANII